MLNYKKLYEHLLLDNDRLYMKNLDLEIENDKLQQKIDEYERQIYDARMYCDSILGTLKVEEKES